MLELQGNMMFKIFLAVQVMIESLPISSSGHQLLLWYALHRLCLHAGDSVLSQNIDYLMHAPTVVVLSVYLAPMAYSFLKNSESKKQLLYFGALIGSATICTLFFFLAKKYGYMPTIPLSLGFAITSLLLCIAPRTSSGSDVITLQDACILGCVQGCALLPGISRLASTYVVARLKGISHQAAFFFVCAMQLPLFTGAAVVGIFNLWKSGQLSSYVTVDNIIVTNVSMVLAYFLLWFTETLMQRGYLRIFAGYMIIPTIIAFLLGL